MNDIAALKEQIDKTQKILEESRLNYEKNPDDYSAQLLLLSTENYLSDLHKQLDVMQMQKDLNI